MSELSPQLKLQLGKGDRSQTILREREAGIQERIVQFLTLKGYLVLETNEHRKRVVCPSCGKSFLPHTGRGTSKGVPDLLVTNPKWERPLWVGIEVKGSHTRLSPEQKALEERNLIVICRTHETAGDALQEIEALLRGLGE